MTLSTTDRRFAQVLCPVDFSEYSRAALRYAAALTRRNKGRLAVLYVNDPLLGAAAAAAAYDVKTLAEQTDRELRRFVARAIGVAAHRTEILTAFGQPAQEIKRAADRLAADLVVMGSRGLTGPGKWFFGSTTDRVLRAAGAPVLVVPKPRQRPRAPWAKTMRSWPGKRILVPVDLDDVAVADVRVAMAVAHAFNAKALLLSVIPAARFPSWLRVDSRSDDRRRVAVARTALEKLARAVGSEAGCRLLVGDPAEQIAACAADVRAGLIVLTLKRASAPLGPRQGSITYRVLASDVAPILAIPQSRRKATAAR